MIHQGDSREVLGHFPDNHFHSIVTDPPYELTSKNSKKGFMGKAWDGSGVAFDVALWEACLRVLRPGGYLLAFGGSRTYHRMACAIEDAGFEIRDSIHWVYGSGFPKSLDVSKAMDKDNGNRENYPEFAKYLKDSRLALGISKTEMDRQLGTCTLYSWWEGRPAGIELPTKKHYQALKDILNLDDRFDALIERIEAERDVIGKGIPKGKSKGIYGDFAEDEYNYTAPATPEAVQWSGWGTSLKPAHEPIVVARKPLEGRVIDNIRKWGCGAINIDASRIGTSKTLGRPQAKKQDGFMLLGLKSNGFNNNSDINGGRFSSNFILQHAPGCVRTGSKKIKGSHQPGPNSVSGIHKFLSGNEGILVSSYLQNYTDSSGMETVDAWDCVEGCPIRELELQMLRSSRFFLNLDPDPFVYQAKASSSERAGSKHPTMKPLKLIKYLLKLVTPPGGVVLDPFLGSGTLAVAAIELGYDWEGIELSPEYIEIAKTRIAALPKTLNEWAVAGETPLGSELI